MNLFYVDSLSYFLAFSVLTSIKIQAVEEGRES